MNNKKHNDYEVTYNGEAFDEIVNQMSIILDKMCSITVDMSKLIVLLKQTTKSKELESNG